MRAQRIFVSFAIAMGCSITLQSTAFSQDYRGTYEQQMACTPDVWRLCSAQVPDVERIVACLQRNSEQLSGRCRAVIAQNGNSLRRGEDRDYRQGRYDREYGQRRYDRDYPRPYDRSGAPRPYDYDDE
jgi:cysteine rich repeat protein